MSIGLLVQLITLQAQVYLNKIFEFWDMLLELRA